VAGISRDVRLGRVQAGAESRPEARLKTPALPPGLEASLDRRRRALRLRVSPAADPGTARNFLRAALDTCERTHTVLVEGVPYCFLPDGYDHIVPPGGQAARIAACRRCCLRGRCPGVPRAFPRAWRRLLLSVLAAPNELVVEVNRRCNLACGVCSSRGLDSELPLEEIIRHLRRARAAGVASVRFTGGEPFLHQGLPAALREARRLGFAVLVNTNATLLDKALIKRCAPFMDNVLVSLQGRDARGEAAATGVRGLFGRKLRALRLLRRAVPVLRLGTVLSGALLRDFDGFLALARRLRADAWELYRPMSRRAADPAVTPAALRRLARRLEREAGKAPYITFANPLPLCLLPPRLAPLCLGARFDDGHTRLVLDPRGFYKPGYYLQTDLGPDLLRAWRGSLRRELTAPGRIERGCAGCALLLRCLGGSRFLAASGADPWRPSLTPGGKKRRI
jgi:MoaA/NifB/PqqE/SkfB family radical SAM enzyme